MGNKSANKSANKSGIVLGIVLATIVLVAAIGGASAADCGAGYNPVCNCGDTVKGDYTFTGSLDCSGAPANQPGLYVGASDITIDGAGYTMTGNRGAADACSHGILYGGAAPPDDTNPAMHSGIANIGNWNNVKITNLVIEEFCTGIALGSVDATDVDYNEVTNCSIYDCGDPGFATQGIHMVQTNNCNIKCNDAFNIDGSGGGCTGGGNGIFMYGNEDTGDGCYNSFTCNNLSYNTKSGFFMKHQCKHNYLGNNYAVWNGEGGIVPKCMKSDDNTYDRNNLSYNYKWGFMTRGKDNKILNNTMIGNGRDGSSPGIYITAHGGNVVNDNTVCGSGGLDIDVSTFATCDDNTCDTHNDGPNCCPWNCDNLVPVYYDFDEDTSYCGLFGTCCNILSVGAGNNPGLFSEDGASTHCDGGFCIYPDPGDDSNDCGVAKKPDLVITEKHEAWINQEEGTYNITYTVRNIGCAEAGASRTKVMIDGSPHPPPGVVPALAPGESFTETLEGPYTCSGGEDTIKLCADGPGQIDELDEGNNCIENVWECEQPDLPDLTITDKYEAWVNATHYNITYTACNIGDGDAGPSKTKVMIDGVPTGIPGNVPALGSGNCSTETLPYTIECSGDTDTIKLCADGPGWIDESNETNNCRENVFGREPDLIIEDTVPFCWCCCRIPIIKPLKGGDGEGEGMPVMFIDNPELAKELGDDELRKEVAEALAKDPKLAAEIAVKLAGDDTKALAKFTRDPREFSKAEFAVASEKLISKPELVDSKLIARCCYRSCNSIKELADLLGDGMDNVQQTDMSELLYEYGANGWWCTDGCGGGCCRPDCITARCCCCCCGYGVAYKIANVGDGDAGWSLSTLLARGYYWPWWHVSSVDIVRPLDAGQSRWEVFPYYSFGPDRASPESLEKYWKVKATVCADATDWVAESDETNNCRTEMWKWPWCCWYPKK